MTGLQAVAGPEVVDQVVEVAVVVLAAEGPRRTGCSRCSRLAAAVEGAGRGGEAEIDAVPTESAEFHNHLDADHRRRRVRKQVVPLWGLVAGAFD